ncbi:MAG: carboxypeptidase regulatory-like domain-containing protein [Acidobacteriaceae bacterium]
MTLRTASLLVLATLTLSGCKKLPHTTTSETIIHSHPAPAVNPATASEISGIVLFKGTPPPRVPIDMSADPGCNQANLPNLTEQYMVNDHHLANVYVYIKSGAPSYTAMPDAPPVIIDQAGCRYIPHVIAVQQGGSVSFLNSDATSHNIHTLPTQPGNASVDISEPAHSAPRTETFAVPEVMLPVRCNNHPWMSAFINVAPNPWFAVTSPDGTFHITGIPPGTYTLAAVHEKLGEQDIQITVAPKSVANASFTFAAR